MAVPSQPDAPTCSSCGAELVADQRYCLTCGHPVSPVRLAFLDVLGAERGLSAAAPLTAGAIDVATVAYGAQVQPGLGGWLRRNTGLLSLLAVLLLCLIAGLLLGHWVTQNGKTASVGGTSTVKIEGLGGLAQSPGASSTTAAGTSTSSKSAAASKSAKKEEEEEAKEAANEAKVEKAPPPKAVKVPTVQAKKLGSSHGKQHQEEIKRLGSAPIEG